jgi:hypothetical protein
VDSVGVVGVVGSYPFMQWVCVSVLRKLSKNLRISARSKSLKDLLSVYLENLQSTSIRSFLYWSDRFISIFIAAIYSTIVAALSSLIERRLLVYDAGKPAPVSSILRSRIGEDLTTLEAEDNNNW